MENDAQVADPSDIDGASESSVPRKVLRKKKRSPKGMTEHGFRNGSDSAIIVGILIDGGLDRQDINERVAKAINPQTKSGRTKNIPSLISGLLARLEERGYYIESSWRLVAPKASDQG